MKKILAVSGGVDSMVLLDVFKNDPEILVAHFNHGTRPSANDDEEFVKRVCDELGVSVTFGHASLGTGVSEENARAARYDFLFGLRDDIISRTGEPVAIYTAHHLDDLVESICINLVRGTGWRGLTPFSSDVYRPFLAGDVLLPESRADILTYAARNGIHFRLDPTNYEPDYMRNRIREKLSSLEPEEHFKLNQAIKDLYFKQKEIRSEIYNIVSEMVFGKASHDIGTWDGVIQRSWFARLDDLVGSEILRILLEWKKISLTRPQLLDFLNAIRTYDPEKKFNLPGDRLVTIHKNYLKLDSN